MRPAREVGLCVEGPPSPGAGGRRRGTGSERSPWVPCTCRHDTSCSRCCWRVLALACLLAPAPPADGRAASSTFAQLPGTFAAKVDYAAGTCPVSVAVGDFNGDGKRRPGDGEPRLEHRQRPARQRQRRLRRQDRLRHRRRPPLGRRRRLQRRRQARPGDGQPASSNVVSVLLGNGSGGFAAQDRLRRRRGPSLGRRRRLQRRRQARPARRRTTGSNTVSSCSATAAAASPPRPTSPPATDPHSVAVGDFNGDGKPDLATANYGSNDASASCSATAAAASAATTDFAAGSHPDSVAVGDFNGDGKADLATAEPRRPTQRQRPARRRQRRLRRARPTSPSGGTRTRSPSATSTATASPTWRRPTTPTPSACCSATAAAASPRRPTSPPAAVPSVAVGDFNGDGKLDLATATWRCAPSTALLTRRSSPRHGSPSALPLPGANTWPSGTTHTIAWTVAPAVSARRVPPHLLSTGTRPGTSTAGAAPAGKSPYAPRSAQGGGSPPAATTAHVYYGPRSAGAVTTAGVSAAFTVTPINVTRPIATSSWPTGSVQTVTWT